MEAAQPFRVVYFNFTLHKTIETYNYVKLWIFFLISITSYEFRNAGFDPEEIRVDPYGNVLYYHADSASPLAWDIDHWFPCSSTLLNDHQSLYCLFFLVMFSSCLNIVLL